MSDLHSLPLMGHDLPEVFPRMRESARVYRVSEGWHWEHQCAPGYWKDSGFPYLEWASALKGATDHLKGCCA